MDFKDYIQAMAAAGTRTRNSIYLLLVVLMSSFATYLNTQLIPVTRGREVSLRVAKACVEAGESSDECTRAIGWAERHGVPITFQGAPARNAEAATESRTDVGYPSVPGKSEFDRIYEAELGRLSASRSNLRTITVPIFGASIDLEHIGLITCIGFLALLLVIRTNLEREKDWVNESVEKASFLSVTERTWEPADQLALVQERKGFIRKSQVLSAEKSGWLVNLVPVALFWACPLLHLVVWKNDLLKVVAGKPINLELLTTPNWAYASLVAEIFILLLLLVLSALCTTAWIELRKAFKRPPSPVHAGAFVPIVEAS